MGTATINEWRYYKSGGTSWTASGSPTSTTLYAGGSYIACIKFTTQSGGYVSNNVKICLNVVRMSGGSTSTSLYCKIGTTAPSTTPQNPYTDSAIGALGSYTTMSCSNITYNSQQFTHTFNFSQLQPGKTYYLWIYGGNGVQLYAHSYYNAVMYGETSPFAPSSVTRATSYHGFYSGSVSFSVTSKSSAYAFIKPDGGSAYYKKTTSGITSGSIIVDQDTSTTALSKTYYLTMIPGYSQSSYSGSVSAYTTIHAPRYAFKAYVNSSSPIEIDSYNYSTPKPTSVPSGYSFQGWSSSASSYTVSYSGSSWSTSFDNVTRYAVFYKAATTSCTLNIEGTTKTASKQSKNYIYGTGTSTTAGSPTYTNCTNPTHSGYDFLGWSTSSSSVSTTYDDPQEALDAGYSGTLYAVFYRELPGTTVTLNANGGSMSYTTAEKIITPIYLYGDGDARGGNTSYHPSSSVVPTRSGCTFLGWSTSSSATYVSYDSTIEALDTGYSGTLYAVWEQNGGVRIFTSSTSSSLYAVYICSGGSWGYYAPYVYDGGWKPVG